ncbi:MAG: polymer-forming cytoskeletal protein [Anaerolineales bacterium]
MFRKKEEPAPSLEAVPVQSRVTSILGEGISWKGEITGEGGLRIEGLFEGVIDIAGLVIVDTKGRVESDLIKAETVIVAGAVRSDIQAQRVEIRSTGRVWGNVTTIRFSTEEGAYLRGKIQMEEETPPAEEKPEEAEGDQNSEPALKPKKSAG